VLAVIVLLGVIAFVVALQLGPTQNTLPYELAKTAMQLIAVAGLGSAATIAVYSFQEATRQAAEDRRDRDEQQRQKEDRLRDERTRQDELVRSTIVTTVKTYNNVKSIRRRLRAATQDAETRRVTLETYDRYLPDLIDQQLQFEELKRLSPLIGDDRLRSQYDAIEKYLGKSITEYESSHSRVAAAANGLALTELPELELLLQKEHFWHGVARPLNETILALQTALLKPFDASSAAQSTDSEVLERS